MNVRLQKSSSISTLSRRVSFFARLTTETRQEVLGETLNMRLGKWLEAVPFEEIKDALTEEWRDQADMISEVKVFQQGNAFAANTRGSSR